MTAREATPTVVRATSATGVASPLDTLAVDPENYLHDAAHFPGGHAGRAFRPRTEADIAAVLRAGSSVLAIGAQSSLTGGATPRGEAVITLQALAGCRRDDDRVVVGPGLAVAHLLAHAAESNTYYPPSPTYAGASVGGTAATNAAGAATFKHGTTRDWVERIRVVLAGGDVLDLRRGEHVDRGAGFEIVRTDGSRHRFERPALTLPDVPKCSCGYFSAEGMDLVDLFVGSEGTLGVISEIELRLLKPSPQWFTGLIPLRCESEAIELTDALRSISLETRRSGDPNGVDVAAIELMDERSLQILAEDRVSERLQVALPPGGALLLVQMELPPLMTRGEAIGQIGRMGNPKLDKPLVRLCRLLEERGHLEAVIPALPREDSKRAALFGVREAVPEGVNRRVSQKAAADVIVPWERFTEAQRRYREIAAAHGLDIAIWGHISDGNVHPNLLPTSDGEAERAQAAIFEMGKVAIEFGGAPMSEHGIGRNPTKQALLRELFGDAGIDSMRRIKRALDPSTQLAPGVIFSP